MTQKRALFKVIPNTDGVKDLGKTILGLDVGTSSIGWSLVDLNNKKTPIVDMGVRIFPEGMDRTKGEQSLNQQRREARSLRRQTYRRVRRKRKLLIALQEFNLLPKDPDKLKSVLEDVEDFNPYKLRTKALDNPLSHFELGRALYHLGQRRGYLSNRKAGDEKDGVVSQSINDLYQEIKKDGVRTLGEYLYKQTQQGQRIRGFYTARRMFVDEFNAIWLKQKTYLELTSEQRKRLFNAIFEQRPLKIQRHLIGKCEFEPERKRAYTATMLAQEFRLWQTLNNLKILFADGQERFLNERERLILYNALKTSRTKGWGAAKKLLGFYETDFFNLERMRKSGLLGNQTAAIIANSIDKKNWNALTENQQEQLVFDLINTEQDEILLKRLRRHWQFNSEVAQLLVENSKKLPKGVMAISHKALRKITPHLRAKTSPEARGVRYDEACQLAGYHHSQKEQVTVSDQLPLPTKDLRNPLVQRAIFQIRKVVNAIIKEHGKPDIIRIEMARDLKNSAKQREEIRKNQGKNERANKKAREFLEEEIGINPNRGDLLKFRLWEECDRTCPYTGESISVHQLFGETAQFEVEHILPFSRTLDNGFMNKTLCHTRVNRDKGKLTPYEAFSGDEKRYAEILQRVKKLPYPKRKRFSIKDLNKSLDDAFVSQQLNETRYIAKEVRDYMAQTGCKIESIKGGMITGCCRHVWGLNNILSDTGVKTRLDHRHHAIDALVVALIDHATVKAFSTHHSHSPDGLLRVSDIYCPIDNIRAHAEKMIDRIIVSHKASRKVSGALHKEFLYGVTGKTDNKNVPEVVIRKPMASLSTLKHINEIRDEHIREMAVEHLSKTNNDFKKAFQNPENPFGFTTKNGGFVPIKTVRCTSARSVTPIAQAERRRIVWTMGNHHAEIVETLDKKQQAKWKVKTIVTNLDAHRRLKQGGEASIIERHNNDLETFVCALHANDMVELTHKGERLVCRVQKMDVNGNITFRQHQDADIKNEKTQIKLVASSLMKAKATFLSVNCLGKVINKH